MHTVPAYGQVCFGREEFVDRILQRAADLQAGYRQNVALVGPPLIGKSSILLRSVELLQQRPPLLPVYLEVRPDGSVADFVEQFAATLLYRYWMTSGRQAPHTFEALGDLCRPLLPKTTALLTQAVGRARRSQASALRLLFEAPGQLRQESGRLCVVMLDEFHRLAAWERAGSLHALGRQIMVQQDTMYVLASSDVAVARRILQERLALLFGHFEMLTVGPFDLATSVRFLGGQAGLKALEMPALIVMADLVEGHPYFLYGVARALAVTEGTALQRVSEALETLVFQPTGILAQHGQQAMGRIPARRRPQVLPVLLAVADGHHRLAAIAATLGRSRPDVARAVTTLAEAGLLLRQGGFCRVTSRLLRFWLASTYRIQQGTVHLDPATARRAFQAAVAQWLRQSTARAPQEILELIEALLRRFRGELVELQGRRVRLPALDVHTLLLPGLPRAVVGRRLPPSEAGPRPSGQRDQTLWIGVPYTAAVRESDAVTFVQTLRSVAKPWSRRIVVALAGIEVNAKLFLQEQRCWVWELASVNHLLELYGLPRVLPMELQRTFHVAGARSLDLAPQGGAVAEIFSEPHQASA